MPKLNGKKAQSVDEQEVQESTGFVLLEPGVYELQLREVEAKEGAKGIYWSWTYEIPEGEENEGKRFWNNTSLSEAAEWQLKATFAAFGVPADTDTDDLIGKRLQVHIGQETAQQGKKQGQLVNTIEGFVPATGKDEGNKPKSKSKDSIPF